MRVKTKLLRRFIQLLLPIALVTGSSITVRLTEAQAGSAPKAVMYEEQLSVSPPVQDPGEVTLTLEASGFAPAEVTRAMGPFYLSVDNRSGTEDLRLLLRASDGTMIREMRVRSGDWSELLDLSPGTYTLSEANHSNWVCAFIIRSL